MSLCDHDHYNNITFDPLLFSLDHHDEYEIAREGPVQQITYVSEREFGSLRLKTPPDESDTRSESQYGMIVVLGHMVCHVTMAWLLY